MAPPDLYGYGILMSMDVSQSISEDMKMVCRNCNHLQKIHYKEPLFGDLECIRCHCMNYEPKDNLSLMEFRYNQSQKCFFHGLTNLLRKCFNRAHDYVHNFLV